MRLVALVALVGCYEPTVERCAIACDPLDPDRACPGDMECGSDFHCHAGNDEPTCTFTVAVAIVNPDGLPVSVKAGETDCPDPCTVEVVGGSEIELVGDTLGGAAIKTFALFEGGCRNDGRNTCALPVTRDTAVTATFSLGRTITIKYQGDGVGRVISDPGLIACTSSDLERCSDTFAAGEAVLLTAIPDSPTKFEGWSSVASCDTGDQCSIEPGTAPITVDASFDVRRLSIITIGNGNDTIAAFDIDDPTNPVPLLDPACSDTCEVLEFPSPDPPFRKIRVDANTDPNRRLQQWFGIPACSGAPELSCELTLDDDLVVVGVFEPKSVVNVKVRDGQLIIEPGAHKCPEEPQEVGSCTLLFDPGDQVTITPAFDTTPPRNRFRAWTNGPCPAGMFLAGDTPPDCTFTVDNTVTVEGMFGPPQIRIVGEPPLPGTLVGGSVSISDDDVNTINTPCVSMGDPSFVCQQAFPTRTEVTLTMVPADEIMPATWAVCPGVVDQSGLVCTVDLLQNLDATPSF